MIISRFSKKAVNALLTFLLTFNYDAPVYLNKKRLGSCNSEPQDAEYPSKAQVRIRVSKIAEKFKQLSAWHIRDFAAISLTAGPAKTDGATKSGLHILVDWSDWNKKQTVGQNLHRLATGQRQPSPAQVRQFS